MRAGLGASLGDILDMAAAAHFLSKAGLLFWSQAGVCAVAWALSSVGFRGEDRVEKETESELSHWFESGEDLECLRRSNERFHAPQPVPEALEARKIPGDKLSQAPPRRRNLRPERPMESPGASKGCV